MILQPTFNPSWYRGWSLIRFVGLTFGFYKFNDEFAKGVVMGELLIGSLSIFNIKLHFIQKVEIK